MTVGDCDKCGREDVDVEIDSIEKRNFCPYCYISFKPDDTLHKSLSQMFNELEKRLKQ
jgi:hypothetical protein